MRRLHPDGGREKKQPDHTADPPSRDVGELSQANGLVLIPMNDYRPGMTVQVVGWLPASITIQLLRLPNDETVPVLERPDEYIGYVVRSRIGTDQVDTTMVVFTRGTLDLDARYTVLADAQVFSVQLKLFRASIRRAGGDGAEND